MLVSSLGEFGLIKRIQKSIKTDSSVIKGSGDDCAVVAFDKGHYMLLTCDMLVEDVDFKPGADPYLIGRKAIAVSLSDIAACGGTPRYCLASLGLPKRYPVKKIDALTRGMIDIAKKYKVNIVGGDLSRADKLTIDVSMVGMVKKRHLALRSGAKKGDSIFVTGKLGGSIKGRHFTFTPRLKEAEYLVRNFKINAMIDISDGLAQDLRHILEESDIGAVVYERCLPVHKDALGLRDVLYGGEDFELLCTATHRQALRIQKNTRVPVFFIGEVTDKKTGLLLLDRNNNLKKIASGGFRHF